MLWTTQPAIAPARKCAFACDMILVVAIQLHAELPALAAGTALPLGPRLCLTVQTNVRLLDLLACKRALARRLWLRSLIAALLVLRDFAVAKINQGLRKLSLLRTCLARNYRRIRVARACIVHIPEHPACFPFPSSLD